MLFIRAAESKLGKLPTIHICFKFLNHFFTMLQGVHGAPNSPKFNFPRFTVGIDEML